MTPDLEARVKKLEDMGNGITKNLTFQGYVQLQFLTQSFNANASPNLIDGKLPAGIGSNDTIAKADGTTTNGTFFRLRRTRLRAKYEVDFMRVYLQIDLLPAGGPSAPQGTIARNAEATLIARWSKDARTEFGAGLFEVPFRFELVESSMYRPFLERTWFTQNQFPTERDLGVHAKTLALDDKLVVEAGVLNGQRLGEPRFVEMPDPNRAKDLVGRVNYTLGPVTLGVFGYWGTGQNIDGKNLRFKNFERWGMNYGATFKHRLFPALGETRAMSELSFTMNNDTGVRYGFALPAIPADFRSDVDNSPERGFYVRAEQDLTKWGLAGFRYENYTTDSSVKNNARDVYTLMGGLTFTKLFRVMNEGSVIVDNMHAAGAAPPSKHIFQYSLWVQGSFY